ncbi:hypothetical protein WMY93_009142 [Mugilogobius chulae]|uniref:Transposase element L1Md-A101/L1Md-A102/L1Md-A2 n=1 Tax=Mugilogobius chulae TaxID=88201 RepID=A0AAW0PEJ5_9GOBI
MCREMATSIMEKIDQRFDAFDIRFQSLHSEQTDLKHRMDSQEQASSALERRVEELEGKCVDLAKHANQLQTKLHDLEARSRRHNIKIVGIPEGTEEGRPTDFVSRLIPELLGKEHFPRPVKIDRAHRTLQPKPAQGAKPRTILARIHHFQEKELILRCSRAQKGYDDVMQTLRDEGIKHTLHYPARLHVYWRDEKAPTVYKDVKEAAQSVEWHTSSSRE